MALHSTQFVGGSDGQWMVERLDTVAGAELPLVDRVAIIDDPQAAPSPAAWILRGVASYERYVTRPERGALDIVQPALGRPEASRAALIPVAKSAGWWDLPQDERRKIFEDRSHHIQTGIRYLPAVARRLYQCRELGEPFDFLTWFEYAPSDSDAFEELVGILRRTEEWQYVDREIDIRLGRAAE